MRKSAREIADMLNAAAEEVCQRILPAGKREGMHWTVSYTMRMEGNSLKVPLEGDKKGLWGCFHPQWPHRGQGDMLNLWEIARGVTTKDAILEAKEFLRVFDSDSERAAADRRRARGVGQSKIDQGTLDLPPGARLVEPGSRAFEYLHGERGIPEEVIRLYRVHTCKMWMPVHKSEVWVMLFPSYAGNGENLMGWKAIALDRKQNDKGELVKDLRTNKGGQMHLCGMHACDTSKGSLVVCEGEIDMLSVAAGTGCNAVSVPFGAQKPGQDGRDRGNRWIDNDWEWLEQWQDVAVAYDNDDAGRECVPNVMRRLGIERTRNVVWPEQGDDGNEVFLRDPECMLYCVEKAAGIAPERLKGALWFADAVWGRLFPQDDKEPGSEPPWSLPFLFRPGEVTIWTGYNKHGKTIMLSNCLVHFAGLGEGCMVASLEMPAAQTLATVYRQVTGQRRHFDDGGVPDREFFDRAMQWIDERFLIYDKVGVVNPADVLDAAKYCVRRHNTRHVVLDSLMRLEVKEDDYETQKELVNRLTEFAALYGVHVHLVCHSKKPSEKRPEDRFPPSKYDIKGAGSISDIAQNVVCAWRNKSKEAKINAFYLDKDAGLEVDESRLEQIEAEPDAKFYVYAQRTTGEEPMKGLWFCKKSWQFADRRFFEPKIYIN